jgi:ribosomal protein S18 acetylase RimI-like enzyme
VTETRPARAVSVREATEDDLAVVVELRLALLREHADHPIYGRLRRDALARARRLFLSQLRARGEATLLAERGGAVVGILRCVHSGGHPLLHPDGYGYISSVYVRPASRRAGVLAALVRAAERWCRARGLDELRLHNASDNPLSNAAWQALGFDVVEHLRLRRLDPGAPPWR